MGHKAQHAQHVAHCLNRRSYQVGAESFDALVGLAHDWRGMLVEVGEVRGQLESAGLYLCDGRATPHRPTGRSDQRFVESG